MYDGLSSLAWIECTLNSGKKIPIRVDDISRPFPAIGGSLVYFRDGSEPQFVTETAEEVGDLITAKWTEYLAALTAGGPP